MKSSTISASSFVVLSLLATSYGCSSDPGDANPNAGYGGGQQIVGAGGGVATTNAGGGAVVMGASGGNTPVQSNAGGSTVLAGSGGSMLAGGGATASGGAVVGGAGPGAGGAEPGAGGAGPGAGGAPPAEQPPCITDQKGQVVIIGDSYVTGAASPALQPALAAIDPNAAQYRNYAAAGTAMVSGGTGGFIPPQFDQALAGGKDIKLVIMDGGGNDILVCNAVLHPGCNTTCNRAGSSQAKVCTDIVSEAMDGIDKLLKKMADSGVKDVLFFYYPHTTASGGGFNEILDYAVPLVKARCDGATQLTGGKLTCHFAPSVDAFAAAGGDKNPANFSFDGIHPSATGQTILSKLIEDKMKADCLGQTSGCCKSGS